AHEPEGGGCECVRALRDGDDEGDDAGDVFRCEFDLRDERRQRRRIADAGSEQDDADPQQRDVRPGRSQKGQRAGDLNDVAGACPPPPPPPPPASARPPGGPPTGAAAFPAATASPADCAPSAGTSSENRCAIN